MTEEQEYPTMEQLGEQVPIAVVFIVVVVVVVYQSTIINVMVSLGELKLFCIARFTLY